MELIHLREGTSQASLPLPLDVPDHGTVDGGFELQRFPCYISILICKRIDCQTHYEVG